MVTRCCENGRVISVDSQTGQTICSCQYSATPGMMNSYPRVPGMGDVVYPSAAVAAAAAAAGAYQQGAGMPGYMSAPHGLGGIPGPDGTPMYSSLTLPPYEATKEAVENWRNSLPPSAGMYFPYDTSLAYSYPPGFGPIDLNAARRKNATKEATNTLKAWLYEHRKNPYPTKGEKIMLAIITKMTLTQVSTWFANARRRLKKDNKMTWSPKNRSDDEDGDDFGDDENDNSKDDDDEDDKFDSISDVSINEKDNNLSDLFSEHEKKVDRELEIEVNVDDMNDIRSRSSSPISSTSLTPEINPHSRVTDHAQSGPQRSPVSPVTEHRLDTSDRPEQYLSARLPTLPKRPSDLSLSNNCKEQNDSSSPSPVKPKIWSMTDVLRDGCSKTRSNSNGSSSNSSSIGLSSFSSGKDLSPISANTEHFKSAIELHPSPSQFTGPSQGQCYAFLSGNGGATHTWFPSNPLGGASNTFNGHQQHHHYNPYSMLSKPPGMTSLSYPYSFTASSAGPIKTPIPTMRPHHVVPLRPEAPFAPRVQTDVMGH